MTNLIGILDTETNKNRVEFDGNLESDKALVKDLGNKLKTGTFRDLLNYMVERADEEEKPVADEIKTYLDQHNGSSTILEIRARDAEGQYITGNDNSSVIDLDAKVDDYVTKRNIDGEDFDCVEMVVGQITSVGGR